MTKAMLAPAYLLLALGSAAQTVDLASAKLRPVNRQVSRLPERGGVHVSAAGGPGVVWIDGTDFGDGTIDVDVRGKDVMQQSFVGVAFHRKDDQTYESVYLRPFNFQSTDPARHTHAVQYMQVPEFDWPVLREKFPEEFERPVHPSIKPTDWVPLRVAVRGDRVQVIVGTVANETMNVRKLGQLGRGEVGLWVGNGSDGDFANLRITPK
jgi:hypothetical protein